MLETWFSVPMAQHEKGFVGSVLQGSCVLGWIAAGQLCILCGSNLNHPYTLQRSWSTTLLVAAPPQRFPISNHCHTISFGNCTGNLVCHRSEHPPWPLLAPLFLERQKFKKFGQILKKCFFWGQSGKIWSVLLFLGLWLPNSAAILRRPVPHSRFLSRKVHFLDKKNKISAENPT